MWGLCPSWAQEVNGKGWLETRGKLPQDLNGHLHPGSYHHAVLTKAGLERWHCRKQLHYTAPQGTTSVLFEYFMVRENIQSWYVSFDVLDGSNISHQRRRRQESKMRYFTRWRVLYFRDSCNLCVPFMFAVSHHLGRELPKVVVFTCPRQHRDT